MVPIILPLSLLAMVLIGRITFVVFDSKLVKNELEAAKKDLAKLASKKGPFTPAMILDIPVIDLPVLMLTALIFV